MDYSTIKLQLAKPSLKIFRMESAAILISFLFSEFKVKNEITVREDLLAESLNFHLLEIKKNYPDDSVPEKISEQILTDWANLDFFRKFYASGSDIPFYELTPSSEKILNYMQDLDKKEFVGTESRLLKIFEILREISFRSSNDPDIRIAELEKRKSQIESEILEIQSGNLKKFTSTQVKERYYELFDTARRLLSDFREVENNFREIASLIRSKIEESYTNRGEILDLLLKKEDILFDEDQGKSFIAFFEFLMSEEKQTELSDLIEYMQEIPEIKEIENNYDVSSFNRNHFFRKLKSYMVSESRKVNKTNAKIAEGLRKFIAPKNLHENKRLSELIAQIKIEAGRLKESPAAKEVVFELQGNPVINLIMERPLFTPPDSVNISDQTYTEGEDSNYTLSDLESLYNRMYIDKEELLGNIRDCLRYETQISLSKILEKFPTNKGLLDVVGYFSLLNDGIVHFIDEEKIEAIQVYSKESGKTFNIKVPKLVFIKDE